MAFDEVTWAPAIGGGGDNNYNPPGARKLDGTEDTSPPTTDLTGDASGFSTIPTLPELNSSTGLNQVRGYYNSRAGLYNTAFAGTFGSPLSILSYLNPNLKPKASDLIDTLAKIAALKFVEGWNGYPFGSPPAWPISTPTAGLPFYGDFLAFLRKELAIAGTLVCPNNFLSGNNGYLRVDSSYGTPSTELFGSTGLIGQTGNAGPIDRERGLVSFRIPGFVTGGLASQTFFVNGGFPWAGGGAHTVAWNVLVYSSNSDSHAPSLSPSYAGTYYTDENNREGSAAAGSVTDFSLSVSAANIYNRAGGWLSYFLVSNREFTNTAWTSGELDVEFPGGPAITPTLTLVF